MSIFNSLGSNYNLEFVFKSLFSDTSGQYLKLKNFLQEKYTGKTILTYKGREALILALKILNLPKESQVVINGFTCYAVFKAIETAGCTPICLDLDEKKSDLNFSPETLAKALNENKNIKVVVIQNTLGYPCDIEKIEKICTEKNIILIEDIAHCIGAKYKNGKEAGTVGDFVALSFSQDKTIDAVSGGALVIRNKKYQNLALQGEALQGETLKIKQQLKDMLYPLLTYKIRFLYNMYVGKIFHYILKNLNLLSRPMQEGLYDFYSLPDWHCNLALNEFKKLSKQLNHRKEIAKIYAKNLDNKILSLNIVNNINDSSNLRFPIFTESRGDLIRFLKKSKIFVSDIWYDSVAPECPNAIKISKNILNLPTHINVTQKDAIRIAEKINIWLKSQ
ncbi:MAG: aminotransferase class I/II-fold pyridoxal phosphate-dependent enzyme [Candidatus Levybacteria bacterium]|nr:aminotransferase class I/II-fold pyridoxal phosphate-dependent enzyme [Candidatus Levybacteria bacterium]MDZ4228205.1 aminotransferase class I/II-fold pyridoxal phosphate-dependent enzyme [Candidatus Levybacteria bacterium]